MVVLDVGAADLVMYMEMSHQAKQMSVNALIRLSVTLLPCAAMMLHRPCGCVCGLDGVVCRMLYTIAHRS